MANPPQVKLKDITILGRENLPPKGGYLLLPSQLGYHDLQRLEIVLAGKHLVYLVEHGAGLHPLLKTYLDREGIATLVIMPETTDVASYRQAMRDAVKDDSVIIYLPADAAALPAPLSTVPGSKLDFLIKAGIPVVPVYVQKVQDTALPIEGRHSEAEIIMAIGQPLEGEDLTLAAYQEALLGLTEQAFSQNTMLNRSLGYALLQGLKRHGSRHYVIDGKDGNDLRYDKVLGIALALSRYVKSQTDKPRVGIVLPPSPLGLIANIAVLLAGKTPVNLNFTAGRTAIDSAIKQSGIDRFLTADTFVRKMQSFPWPATKHLVMLERLLPTLKGSIGKWMTLSKLLPAGAIATLIGLSKTGGDKEATLLFTSGSSGEPKGVVLTHRNLMANVIQFGSRLNMKSNDAILGCLPLFHSFGCTVTLWYPVIGGLDLVTYPTPLETKKLAELIAKHKISLMISTPTFLRGYLKGVNREMLASIKICCTGAEKLPNTLSEQFEGRFGKRVFEGYGLTETSPASNVNLPDPAPIGDEEAYPVLPAYRLGSVGQLLPGMALRITHVETGETQSIHQSGIIWFKGANVFTGYLGDPKRSAEVLDAQGWFRTGDVGRMDLDGFLYIEGRLSRFSKIAGEMVPHETVEEMLVKTLGLEGESTRRIAIVGVPDIEKGEALVLLTTMPGGAEHNDIVGLRYRLIDAGVPPLWIPKKLIRLSEIPVLASGKLDIKACEKIARAGVPG